MKKYLSSSGLKAPEEVKQLWSEEWDAHIADVRTYFTDNPEKLVEFNIESDPVEKLLDFFEDLNLDARHWSKANANPKLAEG